jgi:imidazoleglycerol phosphate synthase glutamine amidotransferase subunit HisH
VSVEAIRKFSGQIPILGVCLGHQCIGEAFGGKTVPAEKLMHGKASAIRIDLKCPLFIGLPEEIRAARYHSFDIRQKKSARLLHGYRGGSRRTDYGHSTSNRADLRRAVSSGIRDDARRRTDSL